MITCNVKIYKATKETALELISACFAEVSKGTEFKPLSGEFESFEMIAKGFAHLSVCRCKTLNKNQKKEMHKLINEL